MTDTFAIPRKLAIFGIVLPLAAFVGYLLADPDLGSFSLVGLLLIVLTIPLFLRWHHAILVFSWNLSLIVFFLPGAPPLWMLAAIVSLGLALLSRILDKDMRLGHVPSVTWSLLLLALVVVMTMKMTGTIGLRSLGGGSYGGKKYFYILFSIVAYFALSSQRIPLEKAKNYVAAFLLPGLTPVLSNVVYMLGPSMWFFFYIFPTDVAIGQATEDMQSSVAGAKIGRIGGLAFGSTAVLSFMLARFGIHGIFDWSRPWRVAIFICLIAVSMLGGFRSILILNGLMFSVQFFLEGLHKSRLFPALLVAGILTFVGLVPFAQKLPLSAQRALSILPIEVDAAARYDAQGSTEWRLKMWHALWPEVERHFWIGKGFTASAADYYLALESQRRGLSPDYETSLIAGDYHNGPLSIMVPFGIFGVLAFLFFVGAGIRVLYLNYINGHPGLKLINTFLLSSFVVKVIFFLAVFGAIHSDIVLLVGLVGLSISLNGGIASPKAMVSTAKRDTGLPLGNASERLRLERL